MFTLTLNGSPRDNPSSMLLSQAVTDRLPGEKKCVQAYRVSAAPCIACYRCSEEGVCFMDSGDDLHWLRKDFLRADLIVIASPLHFSSLSAPLLTIASRLQPEWHRRDGRPPREKPAYGALVLTGGSLYPNMFEPARIVAAALFQTLGLAFAGMVTASDTDRLPVERNVASLERAAALGAKIRALNSSTR